MIRHEDWAFIKGYIDRKVAEAKLIRADAMDAAAALNRSANQDECYAGVGALKFNVGFYPLQIFTCMGADNKHHAMNKATKLWQQGWDHIYSVNTIMGGPWEFVPVKEYGKLVKEYQQLRKGS